MVDCFLYCKKFLFNLNLFTYPIFFSDKNLVDLDHIIVPVLEHANHWIVVHTDLRKRTIYYVDTQWDSSNHQDAKVHLQAMFHFIKHEYSLLLKSNYVTETLDVWLNRWQFLSPDHFKAPNQCNSWDCGVWICLFADCVCRRWCPVDFHPSEMPAYHLYSTLR